MIEEPRMILPESGDEPAESPAELLPEVTLVYGPPPKSLLREFFEMIVVTAIQLLFLWTFIAQGMMVPTSSMQNTINVGDRFFANKFIFGRNTPIIGALLPARDIRRGDIIIFKYPEDPKTNYIKRIIGLPGETVQLRGTKVFINGQELAEQTVAVRLEPELPALPEVAVDPAPPGARWRVFYNDAEEHDPANDSTGVRYGVSQPALVPEGHYFAMGDNRDNSLDSRFWGFVPRKNIIGHALYVHWSFNPVMPTEQRTGNLLRDLFNRIQFGRMGKAIK